jgi:hypothetical protein
MNPRVRNLSWIFLGAALLATAIVYAPGLHGPFVYDDMSFVLGNERIRVTSLDLSDWFAAAISFPAGTHQGRWLCMLTFAANYYFGGLDPYGFKLTNLAIHLANGFLLFLALRALFELWSESRGGDERNKFTLQAIAVAIAALWLVLPINLTAVLYVSQRLESLSNTFVFLGLAWYLRARLRLWRGDGGHFSLWCSLIVSTGIGALVKESAVLLPLYALCAEIALTRFRTSEGRVDRSIAGLYIALLVVPLIAGLVWLSTWVAKPGAYQRSFTPIERMLTEFRVLVDYIYWTIAPNLDALTLYHDDIQASKSFLDPPSTLASFIVLLSMIAAAIWQLARRPLFSIGIAWFFCAHVLTGTFIPLLFAFEHRNYFASAGLLLAGASLIAIEQRVRRLRVATTVALALFAFYAFTTWMRAEEWSDGRRLAMSEAAKRPDSPIAQYEKARVYLETQGPQRTAFIQQGFKLLEQSAHLPGASIRFEQLLITLHAAMGLPIDPVWMQSLIQKLKAAPASPSDARALQNLNACFIKASCRDGLNELGNAYRAALSHPQPTPALLSVHAEYAWYLANDRADAERDIREAVRRAPFDFEGRKNLIVLLIATNQFDEARSEIMRLERMNLFGMFDKVIAQLQSALAKQRGEQTAE